MIQLQFLPNLSHTHHPTRHCATINDLQSLRRTMLFKPAWLCSSSLCPSPHFTGWASPCLSSHVSSSMKILPAPHPTRWPCPLSSVLITLYYNMLSPRPGLLHRVAQVESRDKGPWSRWQEGLEIHPVLHLPIGGALVPSCLPKREGWPLLIHTWHRMGWFSVFSTRCGVLEEGIKSHSSLCFHLLA